MRIIGASEGHIAELATLQKMYMEHHAKLDDYFTFEDDASAHWVEYMRKFLKEKNNIVLIARANLAYDKLDSNKSRYRTRSNLPFTTNGLSNFRLNLARASYLRIIC
jgi:hypothetical protein